MKICFSLANSADPDEMLHHAAFHLGLHGLPKYLFAGIQNEKEERSGSVVECLTRDRGAAGLGLTGVTALWSLSKTHLS